METITVQFLGTGNAVPTNLRNHTGILISFANEHILVDCGEGMQRQFKIAGESLAKLTRIFITHWHGDHILGLPGLLQTLAMIGYQRTLQIYGPNGTRRHMDELIHALGIPRIKLQIHEVNTGEFYSDKSIAFESQPMAHGPPTVAYSIILKDRVRLDKAKIKKLKLPNSPLLGQLQAGKDIMHNGKKILAKSVTYAEEGKKITIILDTALNDNAVKIAQDADLLIAESTFAAKEAELAKEYKHLTATDAASIAKRAKVEKLALTHISERYEHAPHIIEKEAKKVFKKVVVPKDFDILRV